MKDKIKPNHYPNAGKNDLIQFAIDNNIGAIEFNIIKYVIRYKDKNGIEDLHKAKEYLDRLIKQEQRQLLKEITQADEVDNLYECEEDHSYIGKLLGDGIYKYAKERKD